MIIIISLTEGAAATYFKSLHDSSSRAKTGKLERHGTLCRRQGRRRDVSFCYFDDQHLLSHNSAL